MSRTEACELTNMCMVCDGERVLVQDRLDPNWPGIVFPGGHVEKNESFVESVVREVKEETGLDVREVKLCGMRQWTDEAKGFRYIVLLFKTNRFSGELKSSDEGKVFWIDKKDIVKYALADGFEEVLEMFENDALSENYWWMENGEWKYKNL